MRNALAVTAIGRHSLKIKKDHPPSRMGITSPGKEKSRWAGKNLPRGFKVFARAGELPRQRATARLMVNAYPGPKQMRIPVSNELGFKWQKQPDAVDGLAEKWGLDGFFSRWIEGTVPTELIEKPEIIGRAILIDSIKETNRLMATTAERPFALNLSSSLYDIAILQALGIDYRKIRPKNPRSKNPPSPGEPFKETEAMLFFHMPGNRMVLRWRGHPFDVTIPLKKILGP
jgi:hypothetical protein